MRRGRALILALVLVLPAPVRAEIRIAPGTYDVPALVRKSEKGPEAVFNLRSLSETRILLTGPKARELKLERPSGLKIRIRVDQEVRTGRGTAELLEHRVLSKDERIPFQVGNQLEPASSRR